MTKLHRLTRLLSIGLLLVVTTIIGVQWGTPILCAEEGELKFGMSTALTGPTGILGENMYIGVKAFFDATNRRGGINGRKLTLLVKDDGYEPERTIENIRELITDQSVLALIGNVGTPTAIVALPIIRENQILFYAPFTGARLMRPSPPERFLINYRASYDEELAEIISGLVMSARVRPDEVAFFTQRDGFGDAGYSAGIDALKRLGFTESEKIIHTRYERNTVAIENAVADILAAGNKPKVIIMIGTYAPCAEFIKLAKETGINAVFVSVSFVGSEALAKAIGKTKVPLVITQVVPPYYKSNRPLISKYISDLRVAFPQSEPSFGSLEGYIDAAILSKALLSIQAKPDRKNVIDALEELGSFDLGFGEVLQLSKTEHQASHKVWPATLNNGEFTAFDWKDLPKLLESK